MLTSVGQVQLIQEHLERQKPECAVLKSHQPLPLCARHYSALGMPAADFSVAWERRRVLLGLRSGVAAVASCSLLAPCIFLSSIVPGGTILYAAAEIAFFWHTRSKRMRLDAMPAPPLRVDQAPKTFALTFEAITQSTGVGMRPWLSKWFKGVKDVRTIGIEDVEELLATTVWGGSREEVIQAGHGAQLASQAAAVEAACAAEHEATSLATQPMMQACDTTALSLRPKRLCLAPCPSDEEPELRPLLSSSTFTSSSSLAGGQDSPPAPSSPLHQHDSSSSSSHILATGPMRACMDADHISCSDESYSQAPASAAIPFKFRPGSNPAVSFYRHTTEPLPHWWRPAAVYAAFEFMAWMNHCMLTWAGFSHHHHGCLEYYALRTVPKTSPPQRNSGTAGQQQAAPSTEKPLVLLHGVGMGLLPYIKLLLTLAATGKPVIAVEYKQVGQRWCSHVARLEEVRDDVLGILDAHGCGGEAEAARLIESVGSSSSSGHGAHLVGHSYGTAVASAVLQARPSAVATLTLADPICFHMWYPSLLVNFIYRPFCFFQPGDLGLASAKAPHTPHSPTSADAGAGAASTFSPAPSYAHLSSSTSDLTGASVSMVADAASTLLPTSCSCSSSSSAPRPRRRTWLGWALQLGWAPFALMLSMVPTWAKAWLPIVSLPHPAVLVKDMLLLGPAREMHCAAALCKGLDWRTASLWPEAMPAPGRCIIALSGRDELLPTPMLEQWARAHTHAQVRVAPRLRHADVLLHGKVQDALVAEIVRMADMH